MRKRYIYLFLIILLSLLTFIFVAKSSFFSNNFALNSYLKDIEIFHYDSLEPQSGVIERKATFVEGIASRLKLRAAYHHIRFQFRLNSTQDNDHYPNLFQTDSLNHGVRAELHNGTLAFIIADQNLKNGFRVFNVPQKLIHNRWYRLDLESVSGSYVKAWIDDVEVFNASGSGLLAEGRHIKIGQGFNEERVFDGSMRDIELKTGAISFLGTVYLNFNPKSLYHLFLNSAETLTFLFLFLSYFLFKKIAKGFQVNISAIYSIKRIILYCAIQLFLIFMFPAYAQVLLAYLFLVSLGLGLYVLTIPSFLRYKYQYLILTPILGLALLSTVSAYIISKNINFNYSLSIFVLNGLFLAFLAFVRHKNDFKELFLDVKKDFHQIIFYMTVIVTPVILILLLPTLFTSYTTSPMRIGPDIGSYAKMAKFLFDGGTNVIANSRAWEFSGMSAGEITKYADATMTWPFMYFSRWGLAAYQALFALITEANHVYGVMFSSIILPYLLLGGLIALWLKSSGKFNSLLIWFGFLAFIFNVNLINLWYEGFYGNVFSLVFYALIIFIFSQLNTLSSLNKIDKYKSFALLTIIFSAILSSYGEGLLFILPPLFLITCILDYLTYKKINFAPYVIIALSGLAGLLILWPCHFVVDWALLAIEQLFKEGGNGFSQPHWAMPHEIFGLSNIYAEISPDLAGRIIRRSWLVFLIGIIFSWFICQSLYGLFKKKESYSVFYISCLLFFILMSFFVIIKNPHNNYTYMKTYIFLLPIMFIPFWTSLGLFFEKYKRHLLPSKSLFYGFITFIIVLNGFQYIVMYKIQDNYPKESQLEFYEASKKINLENAIIYPLAIHTNRIYYSSLIDAPWMIEEFWNKNNWGNHPYYNLYLNHKIFLFLEKEKGIKYDTKNHTVLLETDCCMLLNADKKVSDIINKTNLTMDFNKLHSSINYIKE